MEERRLPNLPPSDEQSMKNNWSARDFWRHNDVQRIELKPLEPCDHFFENTKGGIVCKKCHFGLQGGSLYARDGKAFGLGEELKFSIKK